MTGERSSGTVSDKKTPLERYKLWLERFSPSLSHFARGAVWLLHPEGMRSRSRLGEMRRKHVGERCFIIGNGPSLNRMDLSRLAGENSISLNRGYLLYDRIGEASPYHVTVNPLVVEQWADELIDLESVKFFAWGHRHWLQSRDDLIYIGGPQFDDTPRFSTDPRWDLWEGATVTFVAMQLAYFLGFSSVILIGVDHRFKSQGRPHETVVAQSDDADHFDPDYFGKGARWQLPDLATSELAYALARYYYQRDGRQILDATEGGALQLFPKRSYESLFNS